MYVGLNCWDTEFFYIVAQISDYTVGYIIWKMVLFHAQLLQLLFGLQSVLIKQGDSLLDLQSFVLTYASKVMYKFKKHGSPNP
jgi:hypothetical protein